MESIQSHRKDEHLSLAEKFYATTHQDNPFDEIRIIHNSLPELGFDEISLNAKIDNNLLFEHPYYIEAITGGSNQATKINSQLAKLAAKHHLPMAVGSASVMLTDKTTEDSFSVVREQNPNGIVIANISANATVEQAKFVINFMQANALEVHINTTQELVMPEGEREFYWLKNIKQLIDALDIPVIVKEVGFGISHETVNQLQAIGVTNINVSGRGGTNFVEIENRRNHQNDFSYLTNWGQTTVESLLDNSNNSNINFLASGGISNPLDVIKCGILGAKAVGVAGFFLHVLIKDGYDQLDQTLTNWDDELRKLLVLCGAKSFNELINTPYILSANLNNFVSQRQK